MERDSKAFHNMLILVIVGVLAWLVYAFLSNWSLGYNSDQALIGLMAKSVLETGERPIFVWSVGYQGIFMEVYATALVFHWFEANPFYLNFAPTFYFCGFLALFYLVLQKYFDRTIASLSCLFLLLSTPTLYLLTMRALPNFSESFLLGMLIFLSYSTLVQRVYVEKILDQKSALRVFVLGLVAGFALYTYVLSWYFFFAVCFCSFFLFLANVKQWRGGAWLSSYLLPQQNIEMPWAKRLLALPVYFFLALGIFGAVSFLLDLDFTHLRMEGKRGLLPIHLLVVSVFFHTAITFAVHFYKYQSQKRQRSLGGMLLVLGILAGFSPKLYYWIVLGGRTRKGATVSGKLHQIVDRLSLGAEANNDFFNLPGKFQSFQLSDYALLSLVLFVMGYLFWSFARKVAHAFRENQLPSLIQRGLPFLALPLVVVIAFSLSSAVVDGGSGRYLLAMLLFYALAYAFTFTQLWRRWDNRYARFVIAVLAGLVLYRGGAKIHRSVSVESSTKDQLSHLVEVLDKEQIRYAYGDYWSAYNVNLFSQERIIVEPIYSNYNPHYAARIEGQIRIGYIDRKTPKYQPVNGRLRINDKNYLVEKKLSIDQYWDLYVLQKLEGMPSH